MPSVAVDTGPLIALFDRDDRHHQSARRFFENVEDDLVTNIAIVTETTQMLDFATGAARDFLGWVGDAIEINGATKGDLARIAEIMAKYADLPADFADASLVAMCERAGIERVATLDKDFDVYRLGNRKRLTNTFLRT